MEEKMRVLDLLENGKITADEAATLIEALAHGNRIESLGKNNGFVSRETRENVEEKWHQFTHDIGAFAKDATCKIQASYKKVEPQLKKAGQSALEQAAAALDTLSCKIRESLEKGDACCTVVCDCDTDCKCADDGSSCDSVKEENAN